MATVPGLSMGIGIPPPPLLGPLGADRPVSRTSRIENLGDITPNATAKGARDERAAVIAVMAGDAQRANLVSGVGSFLPRAAPAEMLLPIDVRRPLSGLGSDTRLFRVVFTCAASPGSEYRHRYGRSGWAADRLRRPKIPTIA